MSRAPASADPEEEELDLEITSIRAESKQTTQTQAVQTKVWKS